MQYRDFHFVSIQIYDAISNDSIVAILAQAIPAR